MPPVYLGRSRVLVETCYGGALIVPGHDLSVTPSLILTGTHELPLTRYFANTVRPGANVIDVGAHVGYFTVLLASLVGSAGRVIAYEAHPEAFRFLLDNLSVAYVRDRVSPVQKAISDVNGELAFFASQRFLGNSSVHRHGDEYHQHYTDEIAEIRVPAEPLSVAIEELRHVDLIKLDIEGGEYRAFAGMRDVSSVDRVREIVFEINAPMMQSDYEPFGRLLHGHETRGRAFFTLTDEGEPIRASLAELLEKGACPFVIMR